MGESLGADQGAVGRPLDDLGNGGVPGVAGAGRHRDGEAIEVRGEGKEAIEFDGKQDLRTKVMIALFGLFAEVERDLISERTKEGLAAAKAKGKRLGRPKGALGTSRLDGREQDIRALLGKDVSKASIAKILSVSRSALYHFIETRKIAPG